MCIHSHAHTYTYHRIPKDPDPFQMKYLITHVVKITVVVKSKLYLKLTRISA